MPPTYTPLDTSSYDSIIQRALARKPKTLQEIDKEELKRKVLEASQKIQELSLQKQQEAFERDSGFRQKVTETLGASSPNGQPPDFTQALEAAKRIALSSGDLDKAIQIDEAQRLSNQYGKGDIPYQGEALELINEISGVEFPEGSSDRLIKTVTGIKKNKEDIELRKGESKEKDKKRKLDIDQRAPGGYYAGVVDPKTGSVQYPSKLNEKNFLPVVEFNNLTKGMLDALEDSFSRSDPNDLNGPEYTLQRGLFTQLIDVLKKKKEFGAALTPTELNILSGGLPYVQSNPLTSYYQVLKDAGFGRDYNQAFKALRSGIDLEERELAFTHKFSSEPLGSDIEESDIQSTIESARNKTKPKPPSDDYEFKGYSSEGLKIFKKKSGG